MGIFDSKQVVGCKRCGMALYFTSFDSVSGEVCCSNCGSEGRNKEVKQVDKKEVGKGFCCSICDIVKEENPIVICDNSVCYDCSKKYNIGVCFCERCNNAVVSQDYERGKVYGVCRKCDMKEMEDIGLPEAHVNIMVLINPHLEEEDW